MVVGGIDNKKNYLNDVELLAPGKSCHNEKMPPFPLKVAAPVGAFAGKGSTVVCGGATTLYRNCKVYPGDKKICENNLECVKTAGEAEWCTGPKTDACYTFNILTDRWEKSGKLLQPRAYASSVVLSNGKVWVLGGLGRTEVLKSTEILENTGFGVWKVEKGPDLPMPLFSHCTTMLPGGKVSQLLKNNVIFQYKTSFKLL